MFQIRNKKLKTIFLSLNFCQITHLRDVKSFVGQYSSLNSENEKKNRKILKTIANANLATIQYIKILRTISLSQEAIQYPSVKPEKDSLAQRSIHLEHAKNFQKFENFFKFYPNITKTGVIIFITIPLTPVTMHQLIIKPWSRSQGPWCRQKFKKMQRL